MELQCIGTSDEWESLILSDGGNSSKYFEDLPEKRA